MCTLLCSLELLTDSPQCVGKELSSVPHYHEFVFSSMREISNNHMCSTSVCVCSVCV